MKRLFVFFMIAIFIAGTVSAQAIREQQRDSDSRTRDGQLRNTAPRAGNNRVRENNSVTVEGVLKLEKGFIAVESADNVYYVPMLNRYIGFIAGLKEGAKVSVEGREFRNMVRPEKVTIDGKTYDFPVWDRGNGQGYGRQSSHLSGKFRHAPNQRWNGHGDRNRYGRDGCR